MAFSIKYCVRERERESQDVLPKVSYFREIQCEAHCRRAASMFTAEILNVLVGRTLF